MSPVDDWWDREAPPDEPRGAVAMAFLIGSLIAFLFGCGVGAWLL